MPVTPGQSHLPRPDRHVGTSSCPDERRSPKPTGSISCSTRLAAGLPVTGETIAHMGVGGLQGRHRPPPSACASNGPLATVAAVVLAAGQSKPDGAAA